MNNEQNKVNNQEQSDALLERLDDKREVQTERIVRKISANTYVPITVLVIVVMVGIYVGTLATTVSAMKEKDSPSRAEYNQMCEQLNKIQNGVDGINTYLRGNNLK